MYNVCLMYYVYKYTYIVCVCVYIYIYIYTCIHSAAWKRSVRFSSRRAPFWFPNRNMYIYIYIYILCIPIHIYIYTHCVYVYVYIYIYIYIYIYMSFNDTPDGTNDKTNIKYTHTSLCTLKASQQRDRLARAPRPERRAGIDGKYKHGLFDII